MNDRSTACSTSDDGSDIQEFPQRDERRLAETGVRFGGYGRRLPQRKGHDDSFAARHRRRLHMTVITSKLIEGDGAPVREAPVHVWGENQLGRANRMKEFFKAATASVAILGAAVAFGAMTASSRFRRDDRIFSKRRRLLPQGRHRPHDGLRLRQHGTMPGGIVWSRR